MTNVSLRRMKRSLKEKKIAYVPHVSSAPNSISAVLCFMNPVGVFSAPNCDWGKSGEGKGREGNEG